MRMRRRWSGLALGLLLLAAGLAALVPAAGWARPLAEVELTVVGIELAVDTATQSVPKGVTSVGHTRLTVSQVSLPMEVLQKLLPQNLTVKGELSGPAFATPITLSAPAAASPPPPGKGPPKDAAEAFDQAGAVFLGEVVQVHRDALGFTSVADVRVEKVWKGCADLAPKVQIDGTGGPTYPARVFALGQRLVFSVGSVGVGSRPAKTFRADSYLHRVVDAGQAGEDAAFLARQGGEAKCAWH